MFFKFIVNEKGIINIPRVLETILIKNCLYITKSEELKIKAIR